MTVSVENEPTPAYSIVFTLSLIHIKTELQTRAVPGPDLFQTVKNKIDKSCKMPSHGFSVVQVSVASHAAIVRLPVNPKIGKVMECERRQTAATATHHAQDCM